LIFLVLPSVFKSHFCV